MSKKPGIFNDPWRTAAPVVPVEKKKEAPPPELSKGEDEDYKEGKRSAIILKDYGGISIAGSYDRSQISVQLIDFCVAHLAAIEKILTKFGVLVAQVQDGALETPLYIRRQDGWTLTIPFAKDKSQAMLQLIQALLEIDSNPTLKPLLRKYKIQPFKL